MAKPPRRRDLNRVPSQAPLAQRLYQALAGHVAERLGCCPIHPPTRLICALCDITWTASASENTEVEALVERTALYELEWPTWPCGRCGTQEVAMCVECYQPVREQAYAGLTPEEEARFQELLVHLVPQSEPGEHPMR